MEEVCHKINCLTQECLQKYVKITKLFQKIEDKFLGVHEYLPSGRGPCYSSKFDDDHPYYIQKSLDKLRKVFEEEINYVEQKLQSR